MPSFVDTNILVYAEDRDAGRKRDVSRELVAELWESREGVLSVQVLQEFYVTVTRKLRKRMPSPRAAEIVEQYLTWRIVDNTPSLLVQAIRLHKEARISLWDALVVQAALDAECDRLYTEDLNSGQKFSSLVVVNPFD